MEPTLKQSGSRGQMTIEFALLFPVMLMIALIACNSILFLSECASFDRIFRESVCVFAPSPASEETTGQICGVKLPAGLKQSEKLPEPIFTPAGKAEAGHHDENITYEDVVKQYGEDTASKLRDYTLALYKKAAEYAASKGIIIADTKFEFGLDDNGTVVLMDEILTPDSSRFWPADEYKVGQSEPSFDKQFIRDWLESQPWNKKAPAPKIPQDVLDKTSSKYEEALIRLTGKGVTA